MLPVDEQDRVLLIRQYRHPVRMHLWEVPAGLLDVEGEPLLDTAQRELREEADLVASTWHTLVDHYTSPGISDEGIRVYLAQGLSEVPQTERHSREAEEAEIAPMWVPLEEAVSAVLAGKIHNPSAVVGILGLHAVRTGGGELRDARAPWKDQPRGIVPLGLTFTGRVCRYIGAVPRPEAAESATDARQTARACCHSSLRKQRRSAGRRSPSLRPRSRAAG